MQNLTARYNYIYNANLALLNHQNELSETYSDNYDQILPVYLGPEVDNTQLNTSLNIKGMDEIVKKSQVIILDKSFSNYLDEAYILLGKANFSTATILQLQNTSIMQPKLIELTSIVMRKH